MGKDQPLLRNASLPIPSLFALFLNQRYAEILGLILALAILAPLSSFALAVEYKTLDNDYFRVEYPAEWTVVERKGDTLDYRFRLIYASYDFGIPFKDKEGRLYSSNFIQVGSNGVEISLKIDPRLKGMFDEDGSIGESIIHFLETFKVKKTHQRF